MPVETYRAHVVLNVTADCAAEADDQVSEIDRMLDPGRFHEAADTEGGLSSDIEVRAIEVGFSEEGWDPVAYDEVERPAVLTFTVASENGLTPDSLARFDAAINRLELGANMRFLAMPNAWEKPTPSLDPEEPVPTP